VTAKSIPPGWYPDPAEPSVTRYWDGEGWEVPASADTPSADAIPDTAVETGAPAAPAPTAPPATPVPQQPLPPNVYRARSGVRPPSNWPADWPFPPPGRVAPFGRPLAEPGKRLAARLIDAFVLLALNVAVNGWFAYLLWQDLLPYADAWAANAKNPDTATSPWDITPPERTSWLILTIVAIFTLLWFAYEVPSTANHGRTLGKRLMRIQVIPMEGEGKLTMGRSIRRWNPMGITPLLLLCCGILAPLALILPFLDNLLVVTDRYLHQALHDRSARTYVVNAPKKEEVPS